MEIKYSKAAAKFLRKQDKVTQKRIMSAIEKIPKGDIVKLQGTSGYRLRIGIYRVIYDIYGNVLDIIDIDNRRQIYKK
jgi:mRNA interferase RelE/StbE